MGFFSWNCKCCGHPMLSPYAITETNGWMNNVVVLEADGSILRGEYDGYGRVGEHEINIDSEKEPECYHRSCWEKAGKPTEYTGASEYSADQGYFFDEGAHDMEDPMKKGKA